MAPAVVVVVVVTVVVVVAVVAMQREVHHGDPKLGSIIGLDI